MNLAEELVWSIAELSIYIKPALQALMDIPIEMAKDILLPDLSLTDLFRVGNSSTLIIGSILYVTDILHIRFRLLYRLLHIMDCFRIYIDVPSQ